MKYLKPEIQSIELDVQISLQLVSTNQPPEEPGNWTHLELPVKNNREHSVCSG